MFKFIPDIALVIAANAWPIVAALVINAVIGWLWFRPGAIIGLSLAQSIVTRLAIYPILGWILIIVGSSWLRIPAIPFRKSAGFLLLFLLAVPFVYWVLVVNKRRPKWTDLKSYVKLRIRPFGGLVAIVGLFALVSINRLTVPELSDVGIWGFDQANYVHITDQYENEGMFSPKDAPSGNLFAPWKLFNANILKTLFSANPLKNSTFEYSSNPDVQTVSRRLALLMRSGGAAVDAIWAGWFRLDGIQAYVTSSYLQYLLLAMAGMWVGFLANIRLLGCIFLGALTSLWPISVFPSIIDNRDQALALVIILVLVSAIFYRRLNVVTRGLALGALALIYIEILPLFIILWVLLHLNQRPLKLAVPIIAKELAIAIACALPHVVSGTHYLLLQLGQTEALKLQIQGNFLGVLSNLAGTFSGIKFVGSEFVLIIAILAGIAFICLQAIGIYEWSKTRQFYAIGGFFGLALFAGYLQQAGYSYPAYKLSTILFPVSILISSTAFSNFAGSPFSVTPETLNSKRSGLMLVLVTLCVPGILLGASLRSGWSFSDLKFVSGMNSALEDRSNVTMNQGLKARVTDVVTARKIVAGIKKKDGILFSNFNWADTAYVAHFLGLHRPIWLLHGFTAQTSPSDRDIFSSNMRFLKKDQKIEHLFLLNKETVGRMRQDTFDNIVLLKGAPSGIQISRTFTYLKLNPGSEFIFVQKLFSQFLPKEILFQPVAKEFLFGNKGVVFGIYCVNSQLKQRFIQFDILDAAEIPQKDIFEQIENWRFAVNGRLVSNVSKTRLQNGMRFLLPLEPDAAGYEVEIGRSGLLPMKTLLLGQLQVRAMGKARSVYVIKNFSLDVNCR